MMEPPHEKIATQPQNWRHYSSVGSTCRLHAPAHCAIANGVAVDLSRYTGDWYEIALLPNRFQSMCVADTQAQYRQDGDVALMDAP